MAVDLGRTRESFEFQMLYGMREDEQERLRDQDWAVRVNVPYGNQWYGYFRRRLAESPRNQLLLVRAVASRLSGSPN